MADTTRPHPRGVRRTGGSAPPDEVVVAGLMPGPWEVPIDLWAYFVRYGRRARGLTQGTLASAAGVSQQTVSKIEGAAICPHDRVKVELARVLEVPTADLFPWPTQLRRSATGQAVWPDLPPPGWTERIDG